MLFRRLWCLRVHTPIFRVHELQSLRAPARLTETTNPRAAREAVLLLRREMKKTQRQKARAIGDPAQHLAAPAKCHLGEQDLALDRGALPGSKLAQRYDARAILIAQRQ
jgi:hypothetical protein